MNRIFKKHSILSLVLVIVLIAAMALSVVSCDKKDGGEETTGVTELQTEAQASTDENDAEENRPANAVGVGNKSFVFTVTFVDGTSKEYTVYTDKTTVGEALLDTGLIAGEDSQYGLYVKTVDGVTLDYNTDGKYWAFYVDGKYATAGVDSTAIEAGKVYTFKAE